MEAACSLHTHRSHRLLTSVRSGHRNDWLHRPSSVASALDPCVNGLLLAARAGRTDLAPVVRGLKGCPAALFEGCRSGFGALVLPRAAPPRRWSVLDISDDPRPDESPRTYRVPRQGGDRERGAGEISAMDMGEVSERSTTGGRGEEGDDVGMRLQSNHASCPTCEPHTDTTVGSAGIGYSMS